MSGPIAMRIEPGSIELDKCYRTADDEVRLVTKIQGEDVTFAARNARYFLKWHETAGRRTVPRESFAEEAVEEVPYFWERQRGRALA